MEQKDVDLGPNKRFLDTARCAVEVTAGLIPGKPMDEYTRRYAVPSSQWNDAQQAEGWHVPIGLLGEVQGRAMGYAQALMLSPDVLNWVRVEWIWF